MTTQNFKVKTKMFLILVYVGLSELFNGRWNYLRNSSKILTCATFLPMICCKMMHQ